MSGSTNKELYKFPQLSGLPDTWLGVFKFMKTAVIIIILVQVLLIAYGIFRLTEGDVSVGLFHIVLNVIFLVVNINTLVKY